MNRAQDAGPWWKEPWPWILMAGPAAAFVGCVVTIVLAVKYADEPVLRDVQKRGLVVEQVAQPGVAPVSQEPRP